MVEIDRVIDEKPTEARVRDLAELRIRNLQAFYELENYNKTGKFLNHHPLIIHYSMREQLKEKLINSPGEFLEDYANTRENVKRYKSFLRNKKRGKDQHDMDNANLKKHMEREALMKEILSAGK